MASTTNASTETTKEPLLLERGMTWLRERAQAARDARLGPAPKRPPHVRLHPPRRGWFAGWWSARAAAASGIRIEEFLHHRLSRYESVLPVAPDRLPVSITIAEGGLVSVQPRAGDTPRPSWLDTYLRAHGASSVQSDVLLAQAEIARVSADIQEHHPRAEAARAEAEEAARDPAIAEVDGGSLEALGRPRVPAPWTAAIQVFAFLLLLAEAWQVAMPVLEASGVATRDLTGEAQRNPAGLALGFVFAIGAAVSLFFFVDLALRRARTLFSALPSGRRAVWSGLAAFAAFGFAAAVSWSIAGLRPGASRVDLEYARFTLFLLALALPVTTSLLLQLGRKLQALRSEALEAAVAWDQTRYRSLAAFTRKAQALATEERELARLAAQREAAVRRIRTLRARAQLAERYAAEAATAEAQELERLCQSIASSLELDRYEFLRQSGARGVAQPRPAPRRGEAEHTLGLAG